MKLRPDEEIALGRILAPIKNDERTLRMKNFIQHGKITTYDHVESVTVLSYWLNKRLHLGADERVLSIGAFLHDYYLYDWHSTDGGNGLHGFSHSSTAMKNAVEHFGVGKKTQNVISSHMWPLTITKIPRCREAWIVCLADKFVSTRETIFCR
ncbi:MAG: HD family phosphohydrolase [Pseudobutyrivibrio sp.]|nr:HD family phosphohydrolase [Pseudobutyrivibrio sp.]